MRGGNLSVKTRHLQIQLPMTYHPKVVKVDYIANHTGPCCKSSRPSWIACNAVQIGGKKCLFAK